MPPNTSTLAMCFLVWIVTLTAVSSTISTSKSKQVTSLKDSMMSSWIISSSILGVRGLLRCGLLCVRERRCVSFLYNHVSRDCRLFAIVMTSSEVTSSAVGYRYYVMSKGSGYYGSTCTTDSQCVLNNTRCFSSRCRCQAGYSFNASANACVSECTSYGPEFEVIPDCYVDQYTQEFLDDTSLAIPDGCLDQCRQATSYTCRSVDIRSSPTPACALAVIVKLDVPSAAWKCTDDPAFDGPAGWVMSYYQRHCSV